MYINIRGILLVLTLTSYSQAIEEPMGDTTEPKSDGLIDDLIMSRRQESNGSDSVSDNLIMNRRQESNKPDGLNDDFIMSIRQERNKGHQKKESTFENYLRKFEPSTIWEQIDKQKKYKGLILSKEEQSAIMINAMDPTDEIMELNIENGNPKLILDQDGRRELGWRPHKTKHGYVIDRFFIRNRMYELMKQAIYTTRNKMVIMQIYREKYRNSSLYKMGFLTNKADNAAKTFGKYSFRAYRGCLLAREKVLYSMSIPDLLSVNERQLNLWFNIEILRDLITENDLIAHEVFKNVTVNRTLLFDKLFID